MLVSGRVITHVTQNAFFFLSFHIFTFQIPWVMEPLPRNESYQGDVLMARHPSLSRWFKHDILPWNLTIHSCKSGLINIYSIYSGFSICSGFSRYLFFKRSYYTFIPGYNLLAASNPFEKPAPQIGSFPQKHSGPQDILLPQIHTETPYSLCKQYTN